jgi:GNAT superfamily N-acetyltransferase
MLRLATLEDVELIWEILQQAILRRKNEGSQQWQDGYPNTEVIKNDIHKQSGFVYIENHEIIGYAAIYINDEPAYKDIIGKWITNDDFVVVHRVALHDNQLGKGFAKKIFESIEELAISKNIFSIKVDTNFDNLAMLNILEKLKYTYCGEVYFRGNPRKAFEKVLLASKRT